MISPAIYTSNVTNMRNMIASSYEQQITTISELAIAATVATSCSNFARTILSTWLRLPAIPSSILFGPPWLKKCSGSCRTPVSTRPCSARPRPLVMDVTRQDRRQQKFYLLRHRTVRTRTA